MTPGWIICGGARASAKIRKRYSLRECMSSAMSNTVGRVVVAADEEAGRTNCAKKSVSRWRPSRCRKSPAGIHGEEDSAIIRRSTAWRRTRCGHRALQLLKTRRRKSLSRGKTVENL
uniref:(northern house mosquito) hypothetical protein n=1 Tax=Culex pipiens TaxID=7175 RepID=A0A8D8B7I6_CULPI